MLTNRWMLLVMTSSTGRWTTRLMVAFSVMASSLIQGSTWRRTMRYRYHYVTVL